MATKLSWPNIRHYPGIYMKGLWELTPPPPPQKKKLLQGSWPPGTMKQVCYSLGHYEYLEDYVTAFI